MALSKKCKEKVKEIREDKNTDETNEKIEEENLGVPRNIQEYCIPCEKRNTGPVRR